MPNTDLAVWASKVGINPPGGYLGPNLASTATIAPTAPLHHVTGTTSITNITLPFTGFVGTLTFIADGAWTMTSGGTAGTDISTVFTAVSGQALDMVYDGTIWNPKISD